MKNLATTPASSTLVFGAVHSPTMNPCQSDEVLAALPFGELALSSEWQTRCVSVTPEQPFSNFGLYANGGSFSVGVDAIRFGPPCHE